MKLLALDPGVHTGYALFKDEKLQASGMELIDGLDLLITNLKLWNPDLVVAERIVPHGLGMLSLNIIDVMQRIDVAFKDNIKWIKAAQWKPLIRDRKELVAPLRTSRPVSTHESDAICIGVFAQRFKKAWTEK